MLDRETFYRTVKNSIRRKAVDLGVPLGTRGSIHSTPIGFFRAVARLGFRPKLIYDVGANWGHWTRDALLVFPDASFVLFEPQDHLKKHVSDLLDRGERIIWKPIGLSEKKGKALFTFRERDDSSNFRMTEEQARVAGLRQAEIEISTIDSFVEESGGDTPDLIKIDAEGLDLQVLAGARKTLETTNVVLVEAGILAGIENSLVKVCSLMDEAGFQLAQITDLNNSGNNRLLYLVELAFIRRESAFFAKADKSF